MEKQSIEGELFLPWDITEDATIGDNRLLEFLEGLRVPSNRKVRITVELLPEDDCKFCEQFKTIGATKCPICDKPY